MRRRPADASEVESHPEGERRRVPHCGREGQAIEPPRDIQQSMELQMRGERERRAAVTTAEASKRAAILEAEGVQQAQINRAQGEAEAAVLRAKGLAEARLAMADAESQTIQRIASSLPHGEAATYLLGMRRDRPPVRCMPGRPVRSSPPRPRRRRAAPRSRTTAGAERGADHARSRRTHRQGPRLENCGEYSYKKLKVKPAGASDREQLKIAWVAQKTCGVCGNEHEVGIDDEGDIIYVS